MEATIARSITNDIAANVEGNGVNHGALWLALSGLGSFFTHLVKMGQMSQAMFKWAWTQVRLSSLGHM